MFGELDYTLIRELTSDARKDSIRPAYPDSFEHQVTRDVNAAAMYQEIPEGIRCSVADMMLHYALMLQEPDWAGYYRGGTRGMADMPHGVRWTDACSGEIDVDNG